MTEAAVLKALSRVDDPDLKKDLVSLGMIENIKIKDKFLKFDLVLTTPACPLKEFIKKECLRALEADFGKIEVDINVLSKVTQRPTKTKVLPQVKNIIAVSSGKGGVGKSTVTANLALTLSNLGARVGVIDADIFGPSMPMMFKAEGLRPRVKNVKGKATLIPLTCQGIKLLSIGFLTDKKQAIVWRGPMASSALKQFIMDTDWGELDYLLVDLPPGTSDIHLTLSQTVALTGAVIVTTPQKVALEDVERGLDMFEKDGIKIKVLGLIENMAYFTPAELPDNKYYIFGKDGGRLLAEINEIPFLGQVPIVQSIREAGDNGDYIDLASKLNQNYFQTIAENLAQQISIRNATRA